MTEHDVAQSKKVVSCMVSVNIRRAYVLFNTGAAHSFVAEVFARKVGLHDEEAEGTLVVSLPNEIQILTTRVCRICEVTVSILSTKIDLIVFQINDRIDCKRRVITFLRPN